MLSKEGKSAKGFAMKAKKAITVEFWQRVAAIALVSAVLNVVSTHANEAEVLTAAVSRAGVAELSQVERKLPQAIMLSRRAGGDATTATARTGDAVSGQADSEPRLYKISGDDPLLLSGAVAAVGGDINYVSSRRPYVTATLSESMVLQLAERPDVYDIQFVTGPRAQGVTEAYGAHRVGELATRGGQLLKDDLNAAEGTLLDGSGVVIGVISLPVKEAHLTALDGHSTQNIPTYNPTDPQDKRLYIANGAALDSDDGTPDGLGMLQLIYDMAPEARVVFASPAGPTTGEMADAINLLVEGDGEQGIPAVNIIVDDLYYPSSNPFEVGEIEEAIDAAADFGVLYVTAAGDSGRQSIDPDGDHTSNVVIADFAAQPAAELGSLTTTYPEFGLASVHNFGGAGVLTVTEALDDLCVFLAEDPTSTEPGSFSATAYIFDENDVGVGFIGIQVGAPGGCLSEDYFFSSSIEPNFKIILEDDGGADAVRLAVVGIRPEGSALPVSTAAFDITTPGSILGHAYSPNVVAAAAVKLCNPNGLAYNDPACTAPFPETEPYSSDGETDSQARYYWRQNDEGAYVEIPGGLAVSKPDLAAASGSDVWVIDEEGSVATSKGFFSGTSASAAVSAGIAALYWQYRQAQVDFNSALYGTAVVPSHIAQAMRGSTLDPDPRVWPDLTDSADWDRNYGWGVLDAPKVLEAPLSVLDLTLTAQSGAATLNFKRSLNDASERFSYTVDCGSWFPSQEVEASDAKDLTEGVEQMPYTDLAVPDTTIECVVTASVTLQEGDPPAPKRYNTPASVEVTVPGVLPPTVSMASSPAAVTMSFEAPPLPSLVTAAYAANCSLDGTPVVLGANNAVLPGTPYDVFAAPGSELTCEVSVTIDVGEATDTATSEPMTMTAGSVAQTTITLSPEPGGFLIQVDTDSNLIDPSILTVFVTCTQGNEAIVEQVIAGARLSVETDSVAPVSCTASAALNVGGATVELSDPVFSGDLNSVTPEEALPQGLPIWLLYQATQ